MAFLGGSSKNDLWASVSSKGPEREDLEKDKLLEAFLDSKAPLASPAQLKQREEILVKLQAICMDWVAEVGLELGMSDAMARAAGGRIFTFGSYRLGLVEPGSDIDALIVAPRHIGREHFFSSLVKRLQGHPSITELTPVPEAYAPIIKLKFDDIDIDLLFARLNQGSVDPQLPDLDDDNLLRNMDDRSVRCLNGTRVADQMLSLVPNHKTFRQTLRFVKLFAKERGLYANISGYFGGITWAILVARVCQMYPNASSSMLVDRFFLVYSRWNWGNPVHLCPIKTSDEVGLMGLRVWNPRQHLQDRSHLMPIVTPAFPSMNSTYNVTEATKRVILQQIHRAHTLLQKRTPLAQIAQPMNFFERYVFYLGIEVRGHSELQFRRYHGFVESRLRNLLRLLPSTPGLSAAHLWPREVTENLPPADEWWNHRGMWFIGLNFGSAVGAAKHQVVDLRSAVSSFDQRISEQWEQQEAMLEAEQEDTELKDIPLELRLAAVQLRFGYFSRDTLPHMVKPEGAAKPEPIQKQGEKRGPEEMSEFVSLSSGPAANSALMAAGFQEPKKQKIQLSVNLSKAS